VALVALVAAPAASAQQQQVRPRWTVSARAGGSWDSNSGLLQPGASGTFIQRYGAGISYSRNTPRSTLLLGGLGSGIFHSAQGLRNRFNYSLDGRWSYRPTPHQTYSLSQSVAAAFSRTAPVLLDAGLALPLTMTQTVVTSADAAFQLSPRTDIGFSARRVGVNFDAPDLPDGSLTAMSFRVGRQLSADDAVSGSYSWQRSSRASRDTETHSVIAGWARTLSPKTQLNVNLGVIHFHNRQVPDTGRLDLSGGVGLNHAFRRGNVTAGLSRFITQSFGTGRDRIADLLLLRYNRPLTQRLLGSVGLTYSWNRDPENPDSTFQTQVHSASLGFRATRSLTIGASYGFQLRRIPPNPAVHRQLVQVFITESWSFR